MQKPSILVARAVFPEVLDKLAQHFTVESNTEDRDWAGDELVQRLKDKIGRASCRERV